MRLPLHPRRRPAAEHDAIEKMLERMSALRERGDALPAAERREKAAALALEMASLLGEAEEDDASGDEEGVEAE